MVIRIYCDYLEDIYVFGFYAIVENQDSLENLEFNYFLNSQHGLNDFHNILITEYL